MTDKEQRARELLAAEYDAIGQHGLARDIRKGFEHAPSNLYRLSNAAIRAIVAALTDEASSDTVPTAVIMPVLDGALAALQHIADTLPATEATTRPLVAAYANREAAKVRAAIMLMKPTVPLRPTPRLGTPGAY